MRLAGRCCCWPGPPTQNNRAGWCWLVQAGGGGGRSDQRPATARQSPASPAQPAAATSQISMQQPSSSPAILTSPALTNDEPHSLVRGWWPGMGWPGTRPGHHRAQVQESSRQQTQPLSHESKLSFMTNDCHQPSPAQPARARGSRPRLPRRTGTGTAEWFDDFCAEHDSLDTAAGHAALQLQLSLFTGIWLMIIWW